MSAVVTDIKDLTNKEVPFYVLIAVLLSVLVLSLTMDSAIIPLFFLLSIGMAIVYNLGSNVIKGEISYVTQALAAVLQLGVTMDYSIFCGTVIRRIRNGFREIRIVPWHMQFQIPLLL